MNVAVVGADQVVWPTNYACIAIVYSPASVSSFEAANVTVFPDSVIREGLGPVTVI